MDTGIKAQKEKQWAATTSVAAALGLTGGKLVVGLATGSLGILAEAAHSGLDLVAAVITALAVWKSCAPADREHPYGHGKVENVSALVESFLLLATCGWIIYAALRRIVSGDLEIEVTVWSFAIVVVSILVDLSRSRMLYRAARRYGSQALEADALHFSTDILSSVVVLVGLFCMGLHKWLNAYAFLHYADAVAAMLVGLVVVRVTVKLGIRAVNALMDEAPPGAAAKIVRAVEELPGIKACHNVRIRSVGQQTFVDLHVHADGGLSLKEAHEMTEQVERVIRNILPGSDVVVHAEP